MVYRISATILVLCSITSAQYPAGPAPKPVDISHFPDPLHAFVWRNFNLVETDRMAQVLGTTPANVRAIASSMGLNQRPIPPEFRSRMYLSIIRRNWHLLPYDQLVQLLDTTPEQLAHTLREDDFLWIKLGGLKPSCQKLTYSAPDNAARQRCEAIRKVVEEEFAQFKDIPEEPRLAFLADFTRPIDQPRPSTGTQLRFLYSYFAVYGDALLDESLNPYPDALLQQYADLGVTGVWLHVLLRQLAPSPDFPEFGQQHEKRLENLRRLVARARRFNIGIYLYMNEPRAMPMEFFKNRPDIQGVREGDLATMCTSDTRVRRWMADSLAHVFKSIPDLAGVFTITASENLTNCASHYGQKSCPRCKDRAPAQIIAEVNKTIEEGVHRSSPSARILAWDWGWQDAWSADAIAALPKSIWLQSVSEWSLPLNRGGIKTSVGEYSISAVGPGPRALRHWDLARKASLKRVAKVQLNNTWELSSIPWLPVMDLVAEHCTRLKDVDGLMLSWTLGGYPSPNLKLLSLISDGQSPEQALTQIALDRYGPGAAHARAAWTQFSDAFREYPFDGSVIYNCPVQLGPANLLFAKPTGYSATMVGFPYDDAKGWSGPYGPEVFATQFEKLGAGWSKGIDELRISVEQTTEELKQQATRDLNLARAAGLHFASVARQVRFIQNRDGRKDRLIELLEAESAAAKELYSLTFQDSRIGYEASNHYYYLPQDLIEKVLNCRFLQAQLRP